LKLQWVVRDHARGSGSGEAAVAAAETPARVATVDEAAVETTGTGKETCIETERGNGETIAAEEVE